MSGFQVAGMSFHSKYGPLLDHSNTERIRYSDLHSILGLGPSAEPGFGA